MSRRRKGRDVHGVVLLDKPAGLSSNQAVQKVRRLFDARKAGHTGSLDPFATGLLPVCLGEATKTAGFLLEASKTYRAEAVLGQATTTGDIEGEICEQLPVPALEPAAIDERLDDFRGEILQVPPMYSALKHQGQPLYRLARQGQEVAREPRRVTVHALNVLGWEPPVLTFRVHCSKGTYVRTLAEDMARALGSCAHLRALRRESVGPFGPEVGLHTLQALEARAGEGRLEEILLPPDALLADWPRLQLDAPEADRFRHGNPVPAAGAAAGRVRVYGPAGELLGLGEVGPDKLLKALRMMLCG